MQPLDEGIGIRNTSNAFLLSPAGTGWPTSVANEARKSTCEVIAAETAGAIFPGHEMISGTRVPASSFEYLPPLKGPREV